jgi:hypothetical protein
MDADDDFERVVFADDLPACECCEEPWCEKHQAHYADCTCLGPSECRATEVRNGELWGKR